MDKKKEQNYKAQIAGLQKALNKSKAKAPQPVKAGGGAGKGRRGQGGGSTSVTQAAFNLLDPHSRDVGAKWPDANAARSVTFRSRVQQTAAVVAYDSIFAAILADPSEVILHKPVMTDADNVSSWGGATTATPISGYADILTDTESVRIVGLSVDITVTEPSYTAKGYITTMTTGGHSKSPANANSLPASQNEAVADKQVRAFANGTVIHWMAVPKDNRAHEYKPVNSLDPAHWTSLVVACNGLSATASLIFDIKMDLEMIPGNGKVLAQTATPAAKYNTRILEAVSNIGASLPSTWDVAGAALSLGGMALNSGYSYAAYGPYMRPSGRLN